MSKARIFISYSHRGRGPEWKAALLRALHVFDRHSLLDIWEDGRIRVSSFWDDDIKEAMSHARLAVVLLTAEALESEYILNTEFPFLRERQQHDKLPVFPVVCEECNWEAHDWLRATQAPNESHPLSQLSCAAQDCTFRKLAADVAEELSRIALAELPKADQPLAPDRIYLEKFPLTRSGGQPEELIGREQELALLDLAFAQPHTAIVSLVAWGGVGKTMLVQHWLQRLQCIGWFGARRVYAWSFYSQGTKEDRQASEDTFLAHALAWFGVQCEPTLSPWDKGRLLAEAIVRERTLLILDGIEPLQYPPGPMGGQLRAPGVHSLLKLLARKANATEHRGLCLVTTREPLTDLADFQRREGTAWGSVLRVDLGNLTEEAGAALLHHAGAKRGGAAEIKADDAELLAASREVDGHALTLNLLGRFLARAHGGDVLRRDILNFEEADRKEQEGTTFKMLSAFEKWFAKGGEFGARRLTVMRLLGLFDRPADSGCIAVLRNPPAIAGLTDALFVRSFPAGDFPSTQPLANEDWDETISFLVEFGLVEVKPQETQVIKGFSWARSMTCSIVKHRAGSNVTLTGPPEILDMLVKGVSMLSEQPDETVSWPPANNATAVALDTHPLIREYFGMNLRNLNLSRQAWEEAHGRLYTFLKESVPHWPQGIEALQPLVQSISHGARSGQYDDAYENVYVQRLLRGEDYYLTKHLGAFQAGLMAIAGFFAHPWTVLYALHATSARERVFNDTGLYLGAVGRLEEALEPISVARTTAENCQNWKDAAIAAANLSQLRALLGDLAIAIKDGETAVALANRSQDIQQRILNYVTRGNAFHLRGNLEEASHSFVQADQILTSNGYETISGSLPGFWCCDLLGSRFERAAWCKTITSKPINIPPLSMLTDIENRARVASGDEWAKTSRLNVALDHLTIGRIEIYHLILFTDGKARTRELQATKRTLDAAITEFRQYGAFEFLPFGLLTQAWLRFLEYDLAGAQANLDEAWDIAERGPMRLHMADVHLHRARLFFREKPYPWKSPQDDLAAAEQLINDCGYHRRDKELADAKHVILGSQP